MIVSSIAGRAVAAWISLAIGLGPGEHGPEEPEPVDDAAEPEPGGPSAAQLFQDRRYREAAEAFAREYERDPKPALLFGRGQALLRSGDCFGAIESFEEFLATEPPDADANAAREQVTYCREIIEANSKRNDEATDPVDPPPPVIDEPIRRAEPWHRDPMGSIFVGIGSPVLITGAILYGGSFGIANGTPPEQHTEHDRREGRVRGMAATGLTLLGVGTALVIAGAVRWAMVARRSPSRRARRGRDARDAAQAFPRAAGGVALSIVE